MEQSCPPCLIFCTDKNNKNVVLNESMKSTKLKEGKQAGFTK
jgi:hypothetical protein